MADTSAVPDSRSVALLRHQAAITTDYAEQVRLTQAAEEAQQQINRAAALDRETDLGASAISILVPGRVHELHTTATDWMGEISTAPDLRTAKNEMLSHGTVWYQGLPVEVRADTHEFVEQARGFASKTAGRYGEQADVVEQAFYEHIAALRQREEQLGVFTAAPMPSQPGDPADTFTTGGGQDWLPEQATSSNRAPQLQELAEGSPTQDVVPENDPGLGSTDSDPAVAAQQRSAAAHTAVDASDLEPFPRCAKCHQPVPPVEQAHTADNQPVHGSCVGITGSHTRGQKMQAAPCPTCGQGHVAVRQAPQPSITEIVAGRRVGYSQLPQVDQIADAADNPSATPLPQEVAFPWTLAPGQVENTIGEAEKQIAERETRKGASLRQLASQAGVEAHRMTYNAVVQQGMARYFPGDRTFDPMGRHATLARQANQLGRQASYEAARIIMQGGQDDSGWLGDMGQGGVAPGQQDGGNAPSSNLGEPDPVYGYGGDNGNQPLKPYGADEANDYTNNQGQNWQPGQPLQDDLGGRGYSTETPPGGGAVPKQSSRADSDPEIQRALQFVRNRMAFLSRQP
jgi:hypothetical protein